MDDRPETPTASSSRSQSPAPSRRSSKSVDSHASHPLLGDGDGDVDTSATSLEVADTSATAAAAAADSITSPALYPIAYKTRSRPPSTGSLGQSTLNVFSQPSQAAVATTTSASATSPQPSSPSNSTSLTNKLQSQNLQASAQAAGLNPDSAGWLMLQKLMTGAEKESDKDKAVVAALKALRTGKASLLLPTEHSFPSEINSTFLKDHIFMRDGRNVTTLGGLRGVMADGMITFTSCIPAIDMKKPPPSDTAFLELLNPGTPAVSEGSPFPSCKLGQIVDVNIPRQGLPSPKTAKPAARPRSLVNLFGGQRSTSAGSVPTASTKDGVNPALTATPLRATTTDSLHTIPITAWTIDRPISSKLLSRAIQSSVASHLQTSLDIDDSRLNEMVLKFIRRYHPSSRTPTQPAAPASDPNENLESVDLANADIIAVTAAVQEFFHDARQRLEEANRERTSLADAIGEEEEKGEVRKAQLLDVDQCLERVEAFVCETLYDKLFAPPTSLDRQDDESLSMRIAGLHMLDLTLDHLGIQTEAYTGDPEADDVQRTIKDGLEEIVSLCGKEFQKLQYSDCRTPLAKLNVLISVHKIIADSLGVLPAISMKDEEQPATSTVSPPVAGQVIEMSADTRSLGGRSFKKGSKAASEASDADADFDAERTPRIVPSRTNSSASASAVPAIKLHDTSFREPYQLSTPSEFIEDIPKEVSMVELETTVATPAPPAAMQPTRSHNTTSADAILPLLIYAVVQANPVRLVSHVMFVQRFRADSLMAGEGEYCLCNMEAVRTFLMSCDVASLGLGTGKIISASDLPTPPVRMRQRAGQHLDSMVGTAVGSAGRVLGTAADIGIGGYKILGGLLARTPQTISNSPQPQTLEDVQSVLAGSSATPGNSIRQAILRRGTNTSLVSAKTLDSRISKETEMSDVNAVGASPQQDKAKAAQLASSASISSRLASLPGLARLNTAGSTHEQPHADAQQGLMGGFMAAMPSIPRPFAATSNTTSPAPDDDAPNAPNSLATPIAPESQSRRSTISIFSTPYTSSVKQGVSTPLLPPTPSQTSIQPQVTTPPIGDRSARAAGFVSHSQHHQTLKTANRPRSDSSTSNGSGAGGAGGARGAVTGAFGAVTNLVSNVRHAYSPGVASQASGISTTAVSSSSAGPAIQRFLECEADDLKMSEIAVLLADYKRLAAQLQTEVATTSTPQ